MAKTMTFKSLESQTRFVAFLVDFVILMVAYLLRFPLGIRQRGSLKEHGSGSTGATNLER